MTICTIKHVGLRMDEKLESKDQSDNTDSEKPVCLAGPSMAYKAINRMRRLQGEKPRELGIRSKYIPREMLERIDRLNRELDAEAAREMEKEALGLTEKESGINSEALVNYSESELETEKSGKSDILVKKTDLNAKNSENEEDLVNNGDNSLNLQKKYQNFEISDSYFPKAMNTINRLNSEKNALLLKIRRNFRLFIIIILAFAGYYAYSVYTSKGDESTISSIKASLPAKLDKTTTLVDLDKKENTLTLKIVKSKDAFLHDLDLNEALDAYIETASNNFCKIEFFNSMIGSGNAIRVELDADDDSYHREFTVDKCEK